MSGIGDALSRKVGPFPMVVWAIAGVGGLAVVASSRKSSSSTTTKTVEQVPVPVGAIAGQDNAPMVISPIVRINVPEIDVLTGAINKNTGALGSNTGALGQNTSATLGNTGALGSNTAASGALSGALGVLTGATNANTNAVNGLTSATGGLTSAIGNIPAPVAPAPVQAATAPASRGTYLVRSGDNLTTITKAKTGNGNRWPELYRANAALIDSIARSRGKATGGHWIFPGTTLQLPW